MFQFPVWPIFLFTFFPYSYTKFSAYELVSIAFFFVTVEVQKSMASSSLDPLGR